MEEIVMWVLGGYCVFLLFLGGIVLRMSAQLAVVQSTVTSLGTRFDLFIKAEKDAFEETLNQNTQALKNLAK